MSSIKIGILTTLYGPFTALGQDGLRGAQLALAEFGGEIAGRKVELVVEGSSAMPDVVVDLAGQLLDERGADFIVGPLSGNEGVAISRFAKTRPDRTFLNGASAAQESTLYTQAPNFFSFSSNGVQWIAGLGRYVAETLNYRRIAIVAEKYSFPFSQIAGFKLEYCRAGGHIASKHWVAVGQTDYRTIAAQIPPDIDAIFMVLGGTDVINFLHHYAAANRRTPIIGGAIAAEQSILSSRDHNTEALIGMVTASPLADDNPAPSWQQFVAAYRRHFPDGLAYPGVFCQAYYVNMKAALTALSQVNGDLSNGQQAFQAALRELQLDGPSGLIRLDRFQNAVTTNFVNVVAQASDGHLYNHLVQQIPDVDQLVGIPEAEYMAMGAFGPDNPPDC